MTITGQPGVTSETSPAKRSEFIWIWVAALAAVFLIGFVVYVVTRSHDKPVATYPVTPPATLTLGSPAPVFVLPRLGGGPPVSLASSRGEPTIVNFFASWCQNCQAELAAFATLAAQRPGGVAVVGVDSNDANGPAAQTLLAGAKATYPVGVDADGTVATSYLLNALPVTYFLDAEGRVVHAAFGAQSLSDLRHWATVLTSKAATP